MGPPPLYEEALHFAKRGVQGSDRLNATRQAIGAIRSVVHDKLIVALSLRVGECSLQYHQEGLRE